MIRFVRRTLWLLLLLWASSLAAASDVPRPPDQFLTLEGVRVNWAYPPTVGPPSQKLSSLVETTLVDLRQRFGSSSTRRPLVLLVSTSEGLNQTLKHYDGESVPSWVPAVALTRKAIIIIDSHYLVRHPIGGGATVTHELAHLVLEEAGGPLPRWVHEGLAQFAAHQRPDPSTSRALIMLARGDSLVPITELDQYLPRTHVRASLLYAEALSFIEWTQRHFEPGLHARILAHCKGGARWQDSFELETGLTIEQATRNWITELSERDVFLGLVFDLLVSWNGLALLVIIAFVVQISRRRSRLRQMEEEERWLSQRSPTSDGQNLTDSGDDIV
ncbi:MAG: hypothetical protein OSB09_11480 [Planctomycetota bacterium]|nr:hypothetical protein [Planctomycetota bacterium]